MIINNDSERCGMNYKDFFRYYTKMCLATQENHKNSPYLCYRVYGQSRESNPELPDYDLHNRDDLSEPGSLSVNIFFVKKLQCRAPWNFTTEILFGTTFHSAVRTLAL